MKLPVGAMCGDSKKTFVIRGPEFHGMDKQAFEATKTIGGNMINTSCPRFGTNNVFHGEDLLQLET